MWFQYPCKYGHYDCSDSEGGLCGDENTYNCIECGDLVESSTDHQIYQWRCKDYFENK